MVDEARTKLGKAEQSQAKLVRARQEPSESLGPPLWRCAMLYPSVTSAAKDVGTL
jgi:hypothetical protein